MESYPIEKRGSRKPGRINEELKNIYIYISATELLYSIHPAFFGYNHWFILVWFFLICTVNNFTLRFKYSCTNSLLLLLLLLLLLIIIIIFFLNFFF